MPSLGRLIPFASGDPLENMAIDQVLLESGGSGGLPTLRLYGWSRPTLSLGYFQSLADRTLHPHSAKIDCVRRSTGGGAIVHHHELTYSVVLPVGDSVGAHLDLYALIHGEVVSLLRDHGIVATPNRALVSHHVADFAENLGTPADSTRSNSLADSAKRSPAPFLCFQRRTAEDLIVSGYKVLGSAQRKIRGAVLQHGSLLFRASRYSPELPGISDLTSSEVNVGSVAEVFARRVASGLGLQWRLEPLSESERQRAKVVAETRFGSPQWHGRR